MPVSFRYAEPPRPVLLLDRPNRYLALVRPASGGRPFEAHVPNPGRMEELLVPGLTRGFVVRARGPTRRTRYDLVAVRHGRTLVSIDTRLGNRLVGRWLTSDPPAGFRAWRWRAEVRFGPHRFDFGVVRDGGPPTRLLEVKCSNLKVGDVALFPDAPTARGAAHLRALARASRAGVQADVVFVVQRSDVRSFGPNRALDPEFGWAFDQARRAGVGMRAVRLRVTPTGARWQGWLHLLPHPFPKHF